MAVLLCQPVFAFTWCYKCTVNALLYCKQGTSALPEAARDVELCSAPTGGKLKAVCCIVGAEGASGIFSLFI